MSNIVGEEDGVDSLGLPTTWHYEYLRDRQYDEFLRARYDRLGNSVTTERTFDPDRQWLTGQRSVSPNRTVTDPAYTEIQDLKYTYDDVGNPKTYRNDLPAPRSNLFGGATEQTYTYDPYERIASGTGEWQQATGKLRRHTFTVDYDENSNVVFKNQRDVIRQNNKDNVQSATTYSFNRSYAGPQPHQATSVGSTTYHYDADGNLLGVKDDRDRWIRQMTWDASDRMRTVTDGPQVTEYKYDDTGQRTIERGPGGETLFVNPWVTIRNTNEMWKHIWAGDGPPQRPARRRPQPGAEAVLPAQGPPGQHQHGHRRRAAIPSSTTSTSRPVRCGWTRRAPCSARRTSTPVATWTRCAR